MAELERRDEAAAAADTDGDAGANAADAADAGGEDGHRQEPSGHRCLRRWHPHFHYCHRHFR